MLIMTLWKDMYHLLFKWCRRGQCYIFNEKKVELLQVGFKDLTAGWIDYDSICTSYSRKIKISNNYDQVNHTIKYVDNDGMSRDERAGYVIQKNEKSCCRFKKLLPEATGATHCS